MSGIGQERDRVTYRGLGPHPPDPRAMGAAEEMAALIEAAVPGTHVEHIGSTAVAGLAGKNVIDLQITAEPSDVARIYESLLALGFAPQQGREVWPPERPMPEGTFEFDRAVFFVHCHVVPTTDPDVDRMIEFRDLLRRDAVAREAYEFEKRQIASATSDSLDYTHAKSEVVRRLLERAKASG